MQSHFLLLLWIKLYPLLSWIVTIEWMNDLFLCIRLYIYDVWNVSMGGLVCKTSAPLQSRRKKTVKNRKYVRIVQTGVKYLADFELRDDPNSIYIMVSSMNDLVSQLLARFYCVNELHKRLVQHTKCESICTILLLNNGLGYFLFDVKGAFSVAFSIIDVHTHQLDSFFFGQ